MVDISNPLWSQTDASNTAASPNGYSSSTTPANVVAIQQAAMGAIKRLYERLGPVLTSTGSSNAYVVTPTNTTYPSALVQGDIYCFIANFANTGAATLAYNGLTATAINKMGGSGPTALTGGEIQTNQVVIAAYDGSVLQLISALPFPVVSGYAALTGASFTGAVSFAQGANLASASTTAIGAASGNYLNVTGTTTITAFDTVQAGTERIINFTGVLTLTYNATSLILPGKANIKTAVGDIARFISLGSGNWVCVQYQQTGLSPFSPNLSLGTNGYYEFPGGLMVQWGSLATVGTGGGGVFNVSYPTSFTTATYFATFMANSTNNAGESNNIITSTSASGFTGVNKTGVTITANWFALGV